MQAILDRLVSLLPASLQPYAKALVPLVVALGAAIASWAQSGVFNSPELLTAVGGVVVSLLTLLVRNSSGATVPPPDNDGSVPPAENADAGAHKPRARKKAA